MVRSYKLSFIGIQETQLADADNINVANCWGSDQWDAYKVHATGRSGGLINIWDPLVFTSIDVIKSRYCLINIGNWVGIDKPVILANIYGPQAIPKKEKPWVDLLNLMERRKGIWLILGDFNAVRRAEERFNSNLCARTAMGFNRFIHDGGLHDLKMGGHRFTYFCHDDLKLSKLDRFLVCSDFLSIFPNVVVTALPRETSDHCPILLSTTSLDFGPTPFRFFNSWTDRDDFPNIVASARLHFQGFDTTDCMLAAKLKHLKNKIKEWRATDHPKEVEELKSLKSKMVALDLIAESRALTTPEKADRRDGFKKIIELERFTSLDLKQKSRIRWATDGDENSRFFHGWVNNRIRKNNIMGIMINGTRSTNPIEIKVEAHRFFQNKFK